MVKRISQGNSSGAPSRRIEPDRVSNGVQEGRSFERLHADHPELDSRGDQLQTTDAECEISRSAMQSLNEELTRANGQLLDSLALQRAVADELETILNSAGLATIFLDDALNVRFVSAAAKTLFSIGAADVGRPLADLVHHFANPALLRDARAVLAGLTPLAREVETEDGAWFNCRTLPYRTTENRIEGVVITFADISAGKRAERLANAARSQAEKANFGKSRFLAAASHDLRQPLQTLSLIQGLLARRLRHNEDAQELLARGGEALIAMSGMLNTLLDINQLEAGVIRPQIADFPIDGLLENLKTEFGYHTRAKGLDWRVLPCRSVIRTDPRLLDQMIRNLLSNAVKFTKTGRIVLGCRRRAGKLRIEVYDTGLGIPADRLRAIFDEFHQIDNPSRELSRGLGLGLAIVQQLSDLLGLKVEAQSREGRGSVFAIEAPLAPSGVRASKTRAATEPAEPDHQDGSILIVEDDPALRESLELFLKEEGYRTATAIDGEEAVKLVERKGLRPGLVIVDYNLPRTLSGLQAMARLRATLDQGVPGLVLTGDISTAALHEIEAQGCEHCAKPVSTQDLTRRIRRLLSMQALAPIQPARPLAATAGVNTGKASTIFVVDDDHALRVAMCELLKARGLPVQGYDSAEGFLAACGPSVDGVLLVDVNLPGMDGLALIERLRTDGVHLPAIVITGEGDPGAPLSALRAGAADFIEKPIGEAELLASIDRVSSRSRAAVRQSAAHTEALMRLGGLTARQRQILDMVLAGRPSKIIAADLGISQRTVEVHRAAIMEKTGSRSLSELVRLAVAASWGEAAPGGT